MKWKKPISSAACGSGQWGLRTFGSKTARCLAFTAWLTACSAGPQRGGYTILLFKVSRKESQSCGRSALPPNPILASCKAHSGETLLYLLTEGGDQLTSFLGSASLGLGQGLVFH